MNSLQMVRGDDAVISTPLRLSGSAWSIPVGTIFTFTARDVDDAIVFTKTTAGATISFTGSTVSTSIVPADTEDLAVNAVLKCDLQMISATYGQTTPSSLTIKILEDQSR